MHSTATMHHQQNGKPTSYLAIMTTHFVLLILVIAGQLCTKSTIVLFHR